MEARYVTCRSDINGSTAIRMLERAGYNTYILSEAESAHTGDIAVFGAEKSALGTGAGGHYIRAASHRLLPNEISPQWAWPTSLRIAVFNTTPKHHRSPGLRTAILDIAQKWDTWFPGKSNSPCPWGNPPPSSTDNHKMFTKWSKLAAVEVAGHITPKMILQAHNVTTTYGTIALEQWRDCQTLYVMGCVPFNAPHTDVADKLHPEKAKIAHQALAWVINDLADFGAINEVVFVVAGREMVSHDALLRSLHPFFWPSIADLEDRLGNKFQGPTRLFGKTGARSTEEVGDALEVGRHLIVKSIVEPICAAVPQVSMNVIRWTEFFSPEHLENGWQIAQTSEARRIAEKIYQPRVQAREWYRTVDKALGKNVGIDRTIANLAVYIATGLQLNETPGVMLDVEVDTQYWRESKPILEELASSHHIILSMPQNVCQPWTY